MNRFYLEDLETSNYNFTLKNKEIVDQLLKVLRSKLWDKVIFFDWEDLYDYVFEIKEIWKKEIIFEQVDRIKKDSEINFELNLFQALPNKLDKIESIIKNGTQIWITNFLFFKSERSQKLNITNKKTERLNKIILESVEQSERNIIPTLVVWDKIKFDNLEWINIFLHTKWENSIFLKDLDFKSMECKGNKKIINLFVWPEWWFSDTEIDGFEKNQFKRVHLGDRILRTELAWISSCFFIIQNNI